MAASMEPQARAETLRRLVSEVGRQAKFGGPDEEVARILAHKQNYYVVLKVLKDTDPAEVRANYLRLSRMVHPDKCSLPQAADASAVLNQAKETLTNPLKKRLYDAYVQDVTEAVGPGAEGMTYAEWEASQAMQMPKVPKWVERILRVPVVGQIFALLLLVLLLPLVLLIVLLLLVLYILCLPLNLLARCCCAPPGEVQQAQAEAAQQQQQQQEPLYPHTAPPHATVTTV